MLNASYEVWGIVVAILLVGCWTLKWMWRRKKNDSGDGFNGTKSHSSHHDHQVEHRALMFLMAQQTDSTLAALARTIEKERQKLGVVVRKPSLTDAFDAYRTEAVVDSDDCQSSYDRILPLFQSGETASTIARQLELPEAEISLVMRLNTA